MKAIRIHAAGGPENLCWEETPGPVTAEGELAVRIRAAGVNPVDAKIRAGKFSRFHAQWPAVLGRDFSGTVVHLGSAMSEFMIGDEVFGMLDYERGTYAEQSVASAREIARKPAALSHGQAAALPVAGLTAWQALFEFGKLRRGQHVLIHGAAGGVGHLAAQFAAWAGARVAATCSAKDVDFVRGLGVPLVIDYRAQRFQDILHDMDLVVDLVAGEARQHSWPVLKPGGVLVSTLPDPKPPRADVSGREVVVDVDADQLRTIAGLVAAGRVTVTIDRTFPLSEAGAAHLRLEEGHGRGKIILLAE